ncbi:MAG: electron transfer flavoprotein subunit beta/FixA family protein [Anaerolineae bacterium]
MDIVVLIKQVPDTATRIQDRVKDGRIDLEGVTWVTSPYDEYAVEEALRLRERHGGTVTLLTLGPERSHAALKDMLALGADEAYAIWDPAFEALGTHARAEVLAAAVRKLPHDLVLAGWKGVDNDEGLVPIYLAAALDYPHLSFVVQTEVEGRTIRVRREIEGGKEAMTAELPAVMTAQKGLNEVRYATLKGIMRVKGKAIAVWSAADLGLDPGALSGRAVEVVGIERPAERGGGRMIDGGAVEASRTLARILHEEEKVI